MGHPLWEGKVKKTNRYLARIVLSHVSKTRHGAPGGWWLGEERRNGAGEFGLPTHESKGTIHEWGTKDSGKG